MDFDIATLRSDFEPERARRIRTEYGLRPLAPSGQIFVGKVGHGDPIGNVETAAFKGVQKVKDAEQGSRKIEAIRNPETRLITVDARKYIREISDNMIRKFIK